MKEGCLTAESHCPAQLAALLAYAARSAELAPGDIDITNCDVAMRAIYAKAVAGWMAELVRHAAAPPSAAASAQISI